MTSGHAPTATLSILSRLAVRVQLVQRRGLRSTLKQERHEHVHAIAGDCAIGDLDALLLDPRRLDTTQGLGGPLDADPDCILKAGLGLGTDLRDACDAAHRCTSPIGYQSGCWSRDASRKPPIVLESRHGRNHAVRASSQPPFGAPA